MIFITSCGYLYYIYNSKYKLWRKHRNAGNDHLTVSNYPDVSREELVSAMHGVFPKSETDFIRLCNSSQLCVRDMLDLLKEDYPKYMSDDTVCYVVQKLLLESNIRHKSLVKTQKLLDAAITNHYINSQVVAQIKELSYEITGRDIFKKAIGIVDGHNGSSYFWIMPVRVIDYSNTNQMDNVAEMKHAEISIEEDDVDQYLTPFLYKYYDDNLKANRQRFEGYWIDDNNREQMIAISGFEWYLTYNFFTFDSIEKILNEITDTVDVLLSGRENEYTQKLKIKRGTATYPLIYAKDLTKEEIALYNANRPTMDNTETSLIIDFYQRFLYRMKYMIKVGKENGYDLISFMGP